MTDFKTQPSLLNFCLPFCTSYKLRSVPQTFVSCSYFRVSFDIIIFPFNCYIRLFTQLLFPLINTLTGRWTTCGPSKTYSLAGRWTQSGPSIQQFAKNRDILPAGSCFGSYMVHELYCYTNKHLLQSSLISACQCSVGNYWVWLRCVSLPLAMLWLSSACRAFYYLYCTLMLVVNILVL